MNEGTLPHNFVLPKSDDDSDQVAVAAYQAGETVEVDFVVPAPGSYTYVCVFPGHAASMLGALRSLK
ncbi:MAG: plastocyanin/azurin family copper-binding protein [Gemmatimonadota bacterium]